MRTLFILLCLSFTSNISAQNAYSDVNNSIPFFINRQNETPKLLERGWPYDSIDKLKLLNFLAFLDNPFDQNLDPINVSEISSIWENRPLLIESSNLPKKKDIHPSSYSITQPGAVRQTSPTGLSITTRIVDATAQFLVERTKKELTISFFNKFQRKLNETHQIPLSDGIKMDIQLQTILPSTYLLLDSKQYFDTPSMGKTWITAFKKDIGNLPFSIENTLKTNSAFNKTEIGRFAFVFFDLIDKVKEGYHPMTIIEEMGYSYQKYDQYSIDQYIGLLDLISKNITTVDQYNHKEWVSSQYLIMEALQIKFYTGLIYQQGVQSGLFQQIELGDSITLDKLITQDNYLGFYTTINSLKTDLNKIDQQLLIAKNANDSTSTREFLKYTNSFYKAIDNMISHTYQLKETDAFYQSNYYQKLRPIAYDITNFNRSLQNDNYGESLLTTISFLKHLFDGNKEADGLIKPLTYYANFLIDIIVASENEAIDIKGIIENYALPVGSYRIKRHHSRTIDLNAYPGIYSGYEFASTNSATFGVTAPIGFSFSWTPKKSEQSSASNSIFLSIIDIGAPFSYRFVNDDTHGFPADIKWEQIFSPGLFYIYGFNNSPLAISAGLQYTPQLRKVDIGQITNQESVIRFNLSLNVDIPIFNLWRK